jgi:hypothetical protein
MLSVATLCSSLEHFEGPAFRKVQDVCVPLSKLAESIAETKTELEASSLIW